MSTMTKRELARAATNVTKAIKRRDDKIRDAYQLHGLSLREIADLVGVSHMTVSAIVKRDRQPS